MLTQKEEKRMGKFLSLLLRHQPELVGLELDEQGWTDVEDLLDKVNGFGRKLDRSGLEQIVQNNNKQRYSFSEDGRRIRANQGHSVSVELGYTPVEPPEILFHGTAERNVAAILAQGLVKRKRHHVHLSLDRETAVNVGQRHGKVVVLKVKAGEMHRAGYEFFVSTNGVWLADAVPAACIEVE